MDYSLVVNPIVTPAVVVLAISAAVLVLTITNKSAVVAKLDKIRRKLFTRAGFFWSSIAVFMGVSVWQAGQFFSVTGDGVGFAVAFFLDLVTVVLIHAQLESRYRGDHWKANLFISFIILTCGTSTFANLAMALNSFHAETMLKDAPGWIQAASPYVLASLPLFVILMSIASEMIVNVRPLDQLNEQEYEADEQKRVRLLAIRSQYAIQQAELEADRELRQQQIEAMRAARRAAHKAEMKRIKDTASQQASASQQQQKPASGPLALTERVTDEIESAQIQAALDECEQRGESEAVEVIEETKRTCESIRMRGRTNVTVSEAADLCNCNEKIIKALRTKQILKSPSPNSSLITLASIELYLNNRKANIRRPKQDRKNQPGTNSKKTGVLNETLLAMNGHGDRSSAKLTDFSEILS